MMESCLQFQASAFRPNQCSNCFQSKALHSSAALLQVEIAKDQKSKTVIESYQVCQEYTAPQISSKITKEDVCTTCFNPKNKHVIKIVEQVKRINPKKLQLPEWMQSLPILTPNSLLLNPMSSAIEVIVVHNAGKTTSLSAKKGVLDLTEIENGNLRLEVYSKSTTPPLLLCVSNVLKSQKGVNVKRVDTKATSVQTSFSAADQVLQQSQVTAEFTSCEGERYQIQGSSDSEGKFEVVLPAGMIQSMQAKNGEQVVPKQGSIQVPAPESCDEIREVNISVDVQSTSFGNAINATFDESKVVVLGDVSGSMSGRLLEVLKKSFLEILEECSSTKKLVALGSWNCEVEWCSKSYIADDIEQQKAKDWISSRRATGGNNMRNAIEETMRQFPDVDEIFIMCDGDVSPFRLEGGLTEFGDLEARSNCYTSTNWEAFRKRFESVRFHFVSLNNSVSNSSAMQTMAYIGDGTFKETFL